MLAAMRRMSCSIPKIGRFGLYHDSITILCICFVIRVDGASPSHFAGLATSGSADVSA